MEGEAELENFAMNIGDFLDEGGDFEQEIGDGGPRIALNHEQLFKDSIDSEKNNRNGKKNEEMTCGPSEMAPRPTEQIEPGTLNILLGLYLISAKKKDWGEYEPISLNSIFASIKWYLDGKNYHENVVTSDFFKGTKDALASKEKELKAMGMGNTPNKGFTPQGW